jgi:uncharacterized OsmC-like protein
MSTAPTPSVVIDLAWQDGLRLDARAGAWTLVVDGTRATGPSPVQLLAVALAGCMALDVVDILRRGRYELEGWGFASTASAPRSTPAGSRASRCTSW